MNIRIDIEAGSRISSRMRKMYTVPRFGRDKYLILLSELDTEKAANAT